MVADLKPGQKHPTPTPGFGDRVFYETLYRQRPDSAMAQQWCVEYGVLPHDEAERVYQLVLERKRKGGSSIAVSSSSTPKKKKKKKPTIVKDEGVDPDMQVSGGDAIGKAVL